MAHDSPSNTSRIDRVNGTQEQLEFFGPRPEKMFGCFYLPAGPPTARIVICPSLLAEMLNNHRKEVNLARALAARGFAVCRFHYRGTGHSFGNPGDVTYDSMTEDAAAAGEALGERAPDTPLAYIGTRLGAVVAASAASRGNPCPVALWDPVTQASHFAREARRARLISAVKRGQSQSEDSSAEGEDPLDVVGYPLYSTLERSFENRILVEELEGDRRSVLLVSFSRRGKIKSEIAHVVAELRKRGFPLEVETIAGIPSWWFKQDADPTDRDINATIAWATKTFTSELNTGATA